MNFSPQILFSWTLLGVLCAWTVLCAFLALRPQRATRRKGVNIPKSSGAIPALVSSVPLRRAAGPVEVSFRSVSAVSSEPASDLGSPVG
jgi:hypothetical protein